MKKKDNKFMVELYPDSTDYNFCEVLDKLICISSKYAYIYHDKDIKEDGTSCKLHVHFFFKTTSQRSIKSIAEDICIDPKWIQYATSERACVRYLIHLDNPDKWKYDDFEVKSNFTFQVHFENDLEFIDAWECIITNIQYQNIHTYRDLVYWGLSTKSNSINKLIVNKAYALKQFL